MNQYEGTADIDKIMEEMDEPAENFLSFKVEIVLGKFNNAESWCDKLEEQFEECSSKMGKDQIMPKVHHKNGNIIVGC